MYSGQEEENTDRTKGEKKHIIGGTRSRYDMSAKTHGKNTRSTIAIKYRICVSPKRPMAGTLTDKAAT